MFEYFLLNFFKNFFLLSNRLRNNVLNSAVNWKNLVNVWMKPVVLQQPRWNSTRNANRNFCVCVAILKRTPCSMNLKSLPFVKRTRKPLMNSVTKLTSSRRLRAGNYRFFLISSINYIIKYDKDYPYQK